MPVQSKSTLRILIAEPKAIVRNGLRLELDQHPQFVVVGETGSSDEAFKLVNQHAPDVLILDFPLEGIPAIQLIREVSSRKGNETRMLVFSENRSRARIMGALAAGATGYLLKTEHTSALVKAICRVATNQSALSQLVQDTLVDFVAKQNRDITEREGSVFRLMARGLSDSEIAAELQISESTVRHHLQSICRKIPFIRTRAEAAAWAWMNDLVRPAA